MSQSVIGRPKHELDTPALCVDLDILDANIASMAAFITSRGKHWRPHAKCHKTPAVAHRELAAGAIGLTVAKVSEAEVYAAAGIRDLLIANMIVGETKLERVAALCHSADPIVAVDHYVQAEALATVCRRRGVECRVLLEVNVGLDRVGIRPGTDARDLYRGVAGLRGVRLAGIMGYEGHLLRLPEPVEKRRRIEGAMALLTETRDQMRTDGVPCEIVSAGGTGSYQITSDCAGITELQAGGGCFADPFYLNECGVTGLTPALTVVASVTSRPKFERAITDAGRKSVTAEVLLPVVKGTVRGRPLPDAEVVSLSAEHGTLTLGPQSRDLQIGDKIELIPGYSDFTTILHDCFYGIRDGIVETVWPILARGKIQ